MRTQGRLALPLDPAFTDHLKGPRLSPPSRAQERIGAALVRATGVALVRTRAPTNVRIMSLARRIATGPCLTLRPPLPSGTPPRGRGRAARSGTRDQGLY